MMATPPKNKVQGKLNLVQKQNVVTPKTAERPVERPRTMEEGFQHDGENSQGQGLADLRRDTGEEKHAEKDQKQSQDMEDTAMEEDVTPKDTGDVIMGEPTQLETETVLLASEKVVADGSDDETVVDTNVSSYQFVRVKIAVVIAKPLNNEDRINKLADEVNSFLTKALKFADVHGAHFGLREWKITTDPMVSDHEKWHASIPKDADGLHKYTLGYYDFKELREGQYWFQLALVLSDTILLPSFIRNVHGVWSDGPRVAFLGSKNVYDPKPVGWLFRSSREMTQSPDLEDEMNRRAKEHYPSVFFNLRWMVIPDGTSTKRDWKSIDAVRAVAVFSNHQTINEATTLLRRWYPAALASRTNCPLNIRCWFIQDMKHKDIENNAIAKQNCCIVLGRQQVYLTQLGGTAQDHSLFQIDKPIDPDTPESSTLRDLLMAMKVTQVPGHEGLPLFTGICRTVSKNDEEAFSFKFLTPVKNEAQSVAGNIPAVLKSEFGLNPENFCRSHFISADHTWNPATRTASTPTTNYIGDVESATREMGGPPMAHPTQAIQEDEQFEMNSTTQKEYNRAAGVGEDETVISITKAKVIPIYTNPVSGQLQHLVIQQDGVESINSALTSDSKVSRTKAAIMQELGPQLLAGQEAVAANVLMTAKLARLEEMVMRLLPQVEPEKEASIKDADAAGLTDDQKQPASNDEVIMGKSPSEVGSRSHSEQEDRHHEDDNEVPVVGNSESSGSRGSSRRSSNGSRGSDGLSVQVEDMRLLVNNTERQQGYEDSPRGNVFISNPGESDWDGGSEDNNIEQRLQPRDLRLEGLRDELDSSDPESGVPHSHATSQLSHRNQYLLNERNQLIDDKISGVGEQDLLDSSSSSSIYVRPQRLTKRLKSATIFLGSSEDSDRESDTAMDVDEVADISLYARGATDQRTGERHEWDNIHVNSNPRRDPQRPAGGNNPGRPS